MITITDGTTTLTPDLVTGYTAARTSPNIVHAVLGRDDPEITLGTLRTRRGTLTIWCADVAAAADVVALHAAAGVLFLQDTLHPDLDMAYVVEGDVTMDPDTGMVRWMVDVGFAEVVP